jgi:hypothetical protein
LVLSLVVWAAIRLLIGLPPRPDTLRDAAPYVYGLATLATFLLPTRHEGVWRPIAYSVFVVHGLWVLVLPHLHGFPWSLPTLGADAIVLVARPDVDAAVLGIGAAFGLNDLLRHRPSNWYRMLGLTAFVALSLVGVTTLQTRAGLLATIAVATVTVAVGVRANRKASSTVMSGLHRPVPSLMKAVAWGSIGIVALSLVLLTPTGSRLTAGAFTGSSQARGTIDVRAEVWDKVTTFTFRDPRRTAIGVGFGRNFVDESGARQALEGTVYTNVRSPHNYLVGTLARLGVFGGLLALLVIVFGWALAMTTLRTDPGPLTTLAALVALAMPVVALLGVVLESPFGALPYFWAIGQLGAMRVTGSLASSLRLSSLRPSSLGRVGE